MLSKSLLASLAASGALAHPLLSPRQSSSCATGLHMIVARGSTEPQGEGITSSVVSSVSSSISGSDGIGIDYPASLTDYLTSVSQGGTAMTQDIQSYTQQCPDTKIALLGYSQGAQVVGDVLGGGSLSNSAPIDASYMKNVVAVVLFGDPTHVAGKPYDKGTSTQNGIEPRSNTATLDTYSSILQSYCTSGDEFCDNGGNIEVHLEEISTNGAAAAQFIVSQFNNGSEGGGSVPTATESAGPSPTTGLPGLPTGFPGLPTGFPGLPTGFPGLPTGFPGLPTGFPGLPTGIPFAA